MQTVTTTPTVNLTFRIAKEDLLAMQLLQCKDEARYLLNGVHFEIHPDGKILLIATNGRFMGILRADAFADSADVAHARQLITFTVNYPLVRYMKKDAFDKILVHYDGKQVRFEGADQAVTYDAIDGNFCNWRGVVPEEEFEPFNVSVDAAYITTFARVAKLLNGKRGEQVILMGHKMHKTEDTSIKDLNRVSVFIPGLIGKEFYGIVMPMQMPAVKIPEWLKLPKVEVPLTTVASNPPVTPLVTPTPIPEGAEKLSDIQAVAPGLPQAPLVPIQESQPAELRLPHPIIPPHTVTTKAQARKEREKYVHISNSRSRQSLDRSRSRRHAKVRGNRKVQRRARRGPYR